MNRMFGFSAACILIVKMNVKNNPASIFERDGAGFDIEIPRSIWLVRCVSVWKMPAGKFRDKLTGLNVKPLNGEV